MGGLGSGRWRLHNKKVTVESCQKLRIKDLGKLSGFPQAIRLAYTLNPRWGDPVKLDYEIRLTWTPTPWGARHYYFICPLAGCGKRAAILYLPPGGRYYGCRSCYNLTYKTCQESHKNDSLIRALARGGEISLDEAREMCEILEYDTTGKMTPWLADRLAAKAAELEAIGQAKLERLLEELRNFDPYGHYLTPGELCEKSGLSPDSLAALESARLLLPDHGGKYRPKLAGWGRKLALLLESGWTLEELKAWARGRWSSPNPRQFPPERAAWKCKPLEV